MGMVQPDLVVLDVLQDAFASILQDPSPIRDIFEQRPPDEIKTILDWFGANEVKVELGYPRGAVELPGLFISIMSSTEAKQSIGSRFPDSMNDPNPDHQSEYNGSYFSTGVRVACWTINAALTVWLQNIALSALISSRRWTNSLGLHEQNITVGDFGPLPEWFPDFAFRRDLSLTGLHTATVKEVFPKVKEIDVTGTAFADIQTARATLRMAR